MIDAMGAGGGTHLTPVPSVPADCPIVGVSVAIRRAVALAMRFAPTDLPILLVGPTGSGKELFAAQIHRWSRRPGPWVDVNAGALPREMVESLLFGHRRGAFTGAIQASEGLLAAAGPGTLFLDELTSLPSEGQAKLLRALETGQVRPLGETTNRPIRCRFVAAVQDDLTTRIQRGEFRNDLYQRLAGLVIRLPGLAERPEDIVPLARSFAEERGRSLDTEAAGLLAGRPWPGNVRELRATVHRAVLLCDGPTLPTSALHEAIELHAPGSPSPAPRPIDPGASHPLVELCRSHDWDVGRAAASIGLGRSTLYRRLRASGIDPGRLRLASALGAISPV